jgi:hypothetical protein
LVFAGTGIVPGVMTSSLRAALASRPYGRPRRWVLALSWIGLIALTVLIPTFVAVEIGEAVHPGPAGTAVITHCTDRGTSRYCYGDFRSDDGTIDWSDVRIWGEDGAHNGQRISAHADRSNHEVNVAGSAQNLYFDVIVPLIALGWWVFLFRRCVWKPLRHRTRRP